MKNRSRNILLGKITFCLNCCLLVVLTIALLSCSPTDKGSKSSVERGKPGNLQGKIRVSGAWALYPMMVKWGEEFTKVNPGVKIDISAGGAGKGIADTIGGLVDLGMVSRDINPEEIRQGIIYVPVVKDAVFPTMNVNSPAAEKIRTKGIKKQIFIDLWINEKDLTWGQIAGDSSKERVRVYTRSDACGAAETWAHYLGEKQEDLKGVGTYGDPGLSEAVRKDTSGIGYNNLNYAYDAKTGLPQQGLQIISIDVNENGKVDPEEDLSTKEKAIKAVVAGKYPAPPARDLYLVVRGSFTGITAEFVKWLLSDGQAYVGEVGYIRIADDQIRASITKIGK